MRALIEWVKEQFRPHGFIRLLRRRILDVGGNFQTNFDCCKTCGTLRIKARNEISEAEFCGCWIHNLQPDPQSLTFLSFLEMQEDSHLDPRHALENKLRHREMILAALKKPVATTGLVLFGQPERVVKIEEEIKNIRAQLELHRATHGRSYSEPLN